jgi:16S rRNA (cytosine967-C5)-methyltransferase
MADDGSPWTAQTRLQAAHMQTKTLSLARAAIARASRDLPADSSLRETLRRAKGLTPEDSRETSEAVFAYFRWQGWVRELDADAAILKALELAERFRLAPQTFSDGELSERAIPGWVAQEMDFSTAWVRSLQSIPRLWLRVRKGRASVIRERLWDCEPVGQAALAETFCYTGSRDLFRTPEFQAGDFELQDLNSQIVGHVCGAAPGEKWWDACAGEGGKLLHLSDLMQNQGLIIASDRAAWRLRRLKQRAARAGVFNYRIAPWDGGRRLPVKTMFDGVLVDAPCSGIGTWQRNPHARWTTTASDVAELASIQRNILDHAAAAVRPGGKLVYSVCTLARAETGETCDSFQERHPEFDPLPVLNPFQTGSKPVSRLWLFPQESGGNGMFVATWVRSATKPCAGGPVLT